MHFSINSKKILLFFLFLYVFSFFGIKIYSENVYFFTRTGFSNSQFWERQVNRYDSHDSWKVFSNYFSGFVGAGVEMIIWDIGIKRGSRLYFKGGFDLDFTGLQFVGGYRDQDPNALFDAKKMYQFDTHGGAFYVGLDWDLFVGGTLPKTDLIWGIGCIWKFIFPAYSPEINAMNFNEKFSFYAVPSILFGYDIHIKDTPFKVTPQMRVGFTCNPVIPHDLLTDYGKGGVYSNAQKYSGLYIDISVAFSFASIKWKENP